MSAEPRPQAFSAGTARSTGRRCSDGRPSVDPSGAKSSLLVPNGVGLARTLGNPRSRRQRPPKLYRIGEVVDYSGVSRQTIHNYATMGLIRESRWTGGGHRLFDESVFERLDRISEMKAANKSLQDIRDHFAHLDASDGESISPPGPEPSSSA